MKKTVSFIRHLAGRTANSISFISCLILFSTTLCITNVQAQSSTVREYWIAAEQGPWNYAPSGINKIKPDDGLGPWGQTTVYSKYRYVQYTDGTYTNVVPQPVWMGILGPQIRAIEGDTIIVHFKNMADKPLSMHPHGLRYTPENDGADFALTNNPGAKVAPGDSFIYRWVADEDASPGPDDGSSIVWLYHSHVNSVEEIYDGLIGTIVITRNGKERSIRDPRPRDMDYEFTTMFMVFNEEDDAEEGLMHSMNGYIFGNLEGLEVPKDAKVRWHLIGMGTEVDFHTAHWHGQTVLNHGKRTDVVELMPASMVSVDMVAKNPGTWLYHCHVTDHITAGMVARWTVLP